MAPPPPPPPPATTKTSTAVGARGGTFFAQLLSTVEAVAAEPDLTAAQLKVGGSVDRGRGLEVA